MESVIKLITETKSGTLIKSPTRIKIQKGRIYFLKSPFALKEEIKVMEGARWHGFDEKPRKIWSITDSFRNRFQLAYMMGEDVFEWFDRPRIKHSYQRPLMEHQKELADSGLTYHYQIWGAEMGAGKSLAAQEVIEKSGKTYWYWVGPKSSLPNIEREFAKWHFSGTFELCDIEHVGGPVPPTLHVKAITYERLVRTMAEWNETEDAVPHGVIFDESSRLKTWSSQRTQAASLLANRIRSTHGMDSYVILMSGTPSPKRPTDWWSCCEIGWPGFLREGSVKALENRLAFKVQQTFDSGTFWKTIGWRDSELKCEKCGELEEHPDHHPDELLEENPNFHIFKPAKNEVAYMHQRLKGLVVVKHKRDCLNLPDKRYRIVRCPPSASVQRVAQALLDSAQNAMTGMAHLRELSDGFQYKEVDDGTMACNHCVDSCGEVEEWFNRGEPERIYQSIDMLDPQTVAELEKRTVPCPKCTGTGRMKRTKRISQMVPCPKEPALKALLEECEETGRIVIFAGFTASVDRVASICRKEGWSVVRLDGRGYHVSDSFGEVVTSEKPLDYWSNLDHPKIAFVAHPESGGMSLSLTEARMTVYWSNSFKPEYRIQSEDRIHRKGMDENLGCTIVDLVHLPTDQRVLEIIRENRKLELMTMGEIMQGLQLEKNDGE